MGGGFSRHYETHSEVLGGPVRDLHRLQMEVFASAPKVSWYLLAVAALGVHLWSGWSKSVLKFGLPKEYVQ